MSDCKHPVIRYTGETPCTGPRQCDVCGKEYNAILADLGDDFDLLIDVHGVDILIEKLADAVRLKAFHINRNWQDRPLAARWLKVAAKLERAAETSIKEGIAR